MENLYINGQAVPAKQVPLYCHSHNLLQTATGYGKRMATATMVHYRGRWRRVYVCCFSNVGTCYIGKLSDRLIVDSF